MENGNVVVGNVNTTTNTNQPTVIDDTNKEPEVITTNVDTSDWKTYRNEELGFEVKYPPTWKVQKANNSLTLIIPTGTEKHQILENLGVVDVYRGEKDTQKTLQAGRDKLTKAWLEELGVQKEVSETRTVSDGKVIYILGPFSSPSGMTEEVYLVVSSSDSNVVLSGTFFGGDVTSLNAQLEAIANLLIVL